MSIPTNATKQDIEACFRPLFAKTTETAKFLLLGHAVQMSDESLMNFAQVLQHEGKISAETGNLLPEGWFRLSLFTLHDHDGRVRRSIASIEAVNRCSLARTNGFVGTSSSNSMKLASNTWSMAHFRSGASVAFSLMATSSIRFQSAKVSCELVW